MPFAPRRHTVEQRHEGAAVVRQGIVDARRPFVVVVAANNSVSSGDTVSSIFYLKTQAGWRETDRLGHAGGLTINVIDRFDDDPA